MYRQTNYPTYKLRSGETVYSVARKYGIAPAELAAMNPSANLSSLREGTLLLVPGENRQADATNFAFLQNQMRTLWEQHVWWTRELMISILDDLPDQAQVADRLLENPAQIAALFRPKFGAQAEAIITQLLTEHLEIGAELIMATKAGDAAAVADAEMRWYQNADAIAEALASLSPQFPVEEMRSMLYRHLGLTTQEVVAHHNGDYIIDIETFDEIERQALSMADQLARGIARS